MYVLELNWIELNEIHRGPEIGPCLPWLIRPANQHDTILWAGLEIALTLSLPFPYPFPMTTTVSCSPSAAMLKPGCRLTHDLDLHWRRHTERLNEINMNNQQSINNNCCVKHRKHKNMNKLKYMHRKTRKQVRWDKHNHIMCKSTSGFEIMTMLWCWETKTFLERVQIQ